MAAMATTMSVATVRQFEGLKATTSSFSKPLPSLVRDFASWVAVELVGLKWVRVSPLLPYWVFMHGLVQFQAAECGGL